MQKSLRKLFSWKVLLIILITLISYGQTLQMYFWQDDSALIFKLQNPEGMAGSFGEGIIGYGAYKYLVTPFVPFYPLFGKEPFGYFLIGYLTYLVAIYFFYRFSKVLFERKYAYIATMIFAAGYIGSDIMFRVINSWQTNIGLVLAFVIFEYCSKYILNYKFRYYLLSLFFYWAATEFVYVRSHSLIVPIVLLNSYILVDSFKLKRVAKFVIFQIPFFILFYYRYLTDSGFGGPGLSSLFNQLVSGNIEILSALFANIGNTISPNILQLKILTLFSNVSKDDQILSVHLVSLGVFAFSYLYLTRHQKLKYKALTLIALLIGVVLNYYLYEKNSLWYREPSALFSGILGIHFLIFSFALFLYLYKHSKLYSYLLLFSTVIIITQIFGYYIQYPTSIFGTTHRYFSYSLIGFSLYLSVIVWWLNKNKYKVASILLVGSLLTMHLTLGFTYQYSLVKDRSKPSRMFYQRLTTMVPTIQKGAGFYFDVSQVPPYPFQFGDFFSVGSMPESTALAMYYDVDRYDLYYLVYFDEMVSKLITKEMDITNLHSFYYGENGLESTTVDMRNILKNGSTPMIYNDITAINANPITPNLLKFTIIDSKPLIPDKFEENSFSLQDKTNILLYLNSRKEYYQTATVTSKTDWRYREIDNIHDDDVTTPWQGHRINWHDTKHEEIIIDLGVTKDIGAIAWTNWKTGLAPTSYNYQISDDGKVWRVIFTSNKSIERKDGERIVDVLAATTRYIKMEITETETNDSPAILEIEVIDDRYKSLDPNRAIKYLEFPLSIASSESEWNYLYPYAKDIAFATISWRSNKYSGINKVRVPLNIENESENYEVIIPAGGTLLSNFEIDYSIPIEASISNTSIKNLSLDELVNRNLIHKYTVN